MGFAYFFRKIANLKDSAYFEMRYLVWTAMQLCNLMPYSCPNTSAAGAPRGPGPAPRETSRPTYPRRIRAARRREPGNQGRGGGGGNPNWPPGTPRTTRPDPRGQAGQHAAQQLHEPREPRKPQRARCIGHRGIKFGKEWFGGKVLS